MLRPFFRRLFNSLPDVGEQGIDVGVGKPVEDGVGLPSTDHLDARDRSKPLLETGCCCVGTAGVRKPRTVFEEPHPWAREIPQLRGQLAGLLAAVGKLIGEARVEKHHGIAHARAVHRSSP